MGCGGTQEPHGPGSPRAVPCRFLHPLPAPPGFGATQPGVICAPPPHVLVPRGGRGSEGHFSMHSSHGPLSPGLLPWWGQGTWGWAPSPQKAPPTPCSQPPCPEPTGLNRQRRGGGCWWWWWCHQHPLARGHQGGLSRGVLWGGGCSGSLLGKGGPGPGGGVGGVGQAVGPPRVQGMGRGTWFGPGLSFAALGRGCFLPGGGGCWGPRPHGARDREPGCHVL